MKELVFNIIGFLLGLLVLTLIYEWLDRSSLFLFFVICWLYVNMSFTDSSVKSIKTQQDGMSERLPVVIAELKERIDYLEEKIRKIDR